MIFIPSGCYALLRHHCEVTLLLLLLVLKVGYTPLIFFFAFCKFVIHRASRGNYKRMYYTASSIGLASKIQVVQCKLVGRSEKVMGQLEKQGMGNGMGMGMGMGNKNLCKAAGAETTRNSQLSSS